ncbi:MAG: hypothetical protein HN341_12450 [Verrucomicrobia bacterium]|jgi:hypothetical protein|nr:hypothetical protein [Verrucomicrobiota bacterium]
MNRRTDYCYMAGWIAVGLSCLLVASRLSLREAIPSVVLLPILFLSARSSRSSYFRIAISYAIFWMASCLLAVGCDGRNSLLSVVALATGALLVAPSALHGLVASRRQPQRMDVGVAAAAAAVAAILLISTLGPNSPSMGTRLRLVALLAGGILAWFSGRGLQAPLSRSSRLLCSALFVLITLAALQPVFKLLMADKLARHHAARGLVHRALKREQDCEQLAVQLKIDSALAATLRRQAALAESTANTERQRSKLLAVTDLAYDEKAWLWLMHNGLTEANAQQALNAFMHLASDSIRSEEARPIIDIAVSEQHHPAFLKLWRILGDQLFECALPRDLILDWGRAAYFNEAPAFAMLCLTHGLEGHESAWDAVRMLWQLHMDAHDFIAAEATLSRYSPPPQFTEEALVLQTETARRAKQSPAPLNMSTHSMVAARFAEAVQLLTTELVTPSLHGGDTVTMRFTWRALKPVSTDWKVFLHFRQERYGGHFFQADHRFGDVACQPSQWAIGSDISYELDIPIPRTSAPDTYAILVGIWDGQQRLRVTDQRVDGTTRSFSGDQIAVGKLVVLPRR